LSQPRQRARERWEVLIAGQGGQGVVLAGVVLGRAAAMYEGLYAVQSQLYGPESRGGASRSDVVISRDPVLYPRVVRPNAAIFLSQEAYAKYLRLARSGATVVLDSTNVVLRDLEAERALEVEVLCLPATELAEKLAGSRIAANMVTLGALAEATSLVRLSSLAKAAEDVLPARAREANLKALSVGAEAVRRGLALE